MRKCEKWLKPKAPDEDEIVSLADIAVSMIMEIEEQPTVYVNDGWIPVEERLPEDDDMRFYMCIVENHEEDLPMFCQYDSEYGFGFWHDMYDSVSLGFIDTEFRTNDELGYEKVIAWQPLPEPYKPKKDNSATEHIMSRFMTVE